MKTSVDIDDHLFARVKEIADESGSTVRAMIEAGLHFVVREHGKGRSRYKIPDARFRGTTGFAQGASEASIASYLREMNDELAVAPGHTK
jgi:RNA:NAD 2'-phosphotransferase (TPT1/KptA family)